MKKIIFDKCTGDYTDYYCFFDILGKLFNAAHEVCFSRSKASRSGAISRELINMELERGNYYNFDRNLDCLIRSHNHQYPDTYRWIPEQTSYVFRTASVNSEYGQKFIKSSFPPTTKPQNEIEELTVPMAPSGYYCRGEEGSYVLENDSRLLDNNYFVVPVDVHS